MRRVVVTGLGMVTPLGVGVAHSGPDANGKWISRIDSFDVSDITCRIAGQVPPADAVGGLNLERG